jgi:hypothetical protein
MKSYSQKLHKSAYLLYSYNKNYKSTGIGPFQSKNKTRHYQNARHCSRVVLVTKMQIYNSTCSGLTNLENAARIRVKGSTLQIQPLQGL